MFVINQLLSSFSCAVIHKFIVWTMGTVLHELTGIDSPKNGVRIN
jgi:hypothetical protein